jgi:hypothetical protein
VRLEQVSYFARLADAEAFSRQALGELHRRGVFHAGAVAAVQDGAPWLQGFVDDHRPDATRILDWAHAVAHVQDLAEAVFGEGTPRARRVAQRLRGWLWEQGPARLLAVGVGWGHARPDAPDLRRALAYFTERQAHLDYPAFRAAGWPVGSGATESGHKQIMQARMKRAGMRWARPHVNPLLALTTLDHNGRWPTEGPRLLAAHHARCTQARRARQHLRRPPRHPSRPVVVPPPPPAPVAPVPATRRARPVAPSPHPWRRYGASLSAKL